MDPYIGKIVQELSFVHAEDVAVAAIQSLTIKNALGIYHITDGNSYNRYEFSDISKSILNRKAFRFHIPMPLVKSLAFFLEKVNGWLKLSSYLNHTEGLSLILAGSAGSTPSGRGFFFSISY
jgi:nucleoside-diphosphate-sugar epimerase